MLEQQNLIQTQQMISLLARLLIVMWTITLEVTHVAENSNSLNEAKVLEEEYPTSHSIVLFQ